MMHPYGFPGFIDIDTSKKTRKNCEKEEVHGMGFPSPFIIYDT